MLLRRGTVVALGFLIAARVALVHAALDYKELRGVAGEGELRESLEVFGSERSRVPGYPGCTRAAETIREQFEEMGLERIRTEEYRVTVPVDEGATLRVVGGEGEEEMVLYGLWPNLVRTSMVGPEGLRGPLIYAGEGEFGASQRRAMSRWRICCHGSRGGNLRCASAALSCSSARY